LGRSGATLFVDNGGLFRFLLETCFAKAEAAIVLDHVHFSWAAFVLRFLVCGGLFAKFSDTAGLAELDLWDC
jgi:hypothetical protein